MRAPRAVRRRLRGQPAGESAGENQCRGNQPAPASAAIAADGRQGLRRPPGLVDEPPEARDLRSNARSRADWKRSSGRFSRQCWRSRASAGENLSAERFDLRRLLAQDRRHRLDRRTVGEGASAGEHLVEHDAEREEVRAVIGRLAAHLLGGHVADRAEDRAGLGARSLVWAPRAAGSSSRASRSDAPGRSRGSSPARRG